MAAPALEVVEFIDVKFQNTFLEHTIYRGTPNPERERAWLDLWDCENMLCTLTRSSNSHISSWPSQYSLR